MLLKEPLFVVSLRTLGIKADSPLRANTVLHTPASCPKSVCCTTRTVCVYVFRKDNHIRSRRPTSAKQLRAQPPQLVSYEIFEIR